MHLDPTLLISLLALATTTSSSSPSPPLKTATLYHTPVSPTLHPERASTPLAILTYSPVQPHRTTLSSFTPPLNTSDADALTSVLVYLDNSGDGGKSPYRSTVTATYGFHAPYRGRFRVVLDREGEVVGASWHSYLVRGSSSSSSSAAAGKGKAKGKGKGKGESVEDGRGDFDVLTTKSAPSVAFDKKVTKGRAGGATGAGTGAGQEGEEEVVEKTFLQKYWWVLLGVAVLAMTGGGDK